MKEDRKRGLSGIAETELSFVIWPLASRTAATMPLYAPQRQRLPLIHSRISASLPAWPSSMHATAEQIWPGVQ